MRIATGEGEECSIPPRSLDGGAMIISTKAIVAITAVMLLAVCGIVAVSDVSEADDAWDGTADISWYTDESQDEYEINTAEQLAGLAHLVNGGKTFEDKNLRWDNAFASAYLEEIKKSLADGLTPVLVELKNDIAKDLFAQCQVVDHHDKFVGRQACLLQVLKILKLRPTRQQQLIAANDSGYIPAMLALGASRSEVEEIRCMDWQAQNISVELVEESMRAYENKKIKNGVFVIEM